VRASRIPLVETANFNLSQWTEQVLYEVCMNPTAYEAVEKKSAAAK
jgi:predicted ATP-dependent Lon-type protease